MNEQAFHWEITNRCNLQCTHCLPASGKPRAQELNTAEALHALDKLKSWGTQWLHLTGGEPFSRPDIGQLIIHAQSLDMNVSVITNGTFVSEDVFDIVKKRGVVLGVSLDGAHAATHDAMRGSGSYKKACEFLEQCVAHDIPVQLYATVTAVNFSELTDIAKLAMFYNCQGVHFSEVTLGGRAKQNRNILSLSEGQRSELLPFIQALTRDLLGEELLLDDSACSVDHQSKFMNAEGFIYSCSEIAIITPSLHEGNIKDELSYPVLHEGFAVLQPAPCCYQVYSSGYVGLIKNTTHPCLASFSITSLEDLYQELDEVYADIGPTCAQCDDPDCMGYVWLLNKETEQLYERGVPLVQINNGPTFIHPDPSKGERFSVTERHPKCSLRCLSSGCCTIYENRPLVCRLYPLGLETTGEGMIVWALHEECLYMRNHSKAKTLGDFQERLINILDRIAPSLMQEIIDAYRQVDEISSFPDGGNRYSIVKEVNNNVEMQSRT